jgi:hypothetical protein
MLWAAAHALRVPNIRRGSLLILRNLINSIITTPANDHIRIVPGLKRPSVVLKII